MGFSRQEHWSGFHVLLQGIFPTQGSNPHLRLGRWTLCPFLMSASTLPSRFSGVAGVPELQELKRTAELRSRLRNVSVVG